MVVESELKKFGLHPVAVSLGEAEVQEDLSSVQKHHLNETFEGLGFSIIDDKKSRWIEKIKNLVIQLVHTFEERPKVKLSEYIASNLNHDYSYLSKLFSEVEGITIEHYMILQKIERVKELLVYDEHTLSEIAHQLDYSSVSHLSKQFKKVTGLTPTHFKQIKEQRRSLDEL